MTLTQKQAHSALTVLFLFLFGLCVTLGLFAAFGCGDQPEHSDAPADPDGLTIVSGIVSHEDVYVPGQEGRVDGSVWDDGLFNAPEAKTEFCSSYTGPDAWFCAAADSGADVEKWKSTQLHGIQEVPQVGAISHACFGPTAASTASCLFPSAKQFRVTLDTSSCFLGPLPPDGLGTLQEQAILDGFKAGIKAWNGVGGLIVVDNGSPGSSGYLPITITCADLASDRVAESGYVSSGLVFKLSQLPTAPNGRKQHSVVVGTVLSSKLEPQSIADHFANVVCQGFLFTTANMKKVATNIGKHEGGHLFGFAHFDSGDQSIDIMNPFVRANTCTDWPIQQPFKDAIATFNPGGGSTSVVSDNGLTALQPQ